ncbi:MAG: glycosyltransferase family 2 protein [Selenomonadaceae bacterium]|nr:glycosyltransferase family 2 protein [Selenomonadaceae bacterium]
MKLVSIVVPVYNEEDNINHFYQAICQTMKGLNYNWELVFVDDGSSDSSWEILEKMEEDDSRVQPIKLSRNMGHQLALTCGMDYADGDMVITMDGDMQHPPELIPVLIGAWEQGYEVVQTVRRTTEGVSWIKNFSSNCFYWLINHISDTHVIEGGSDFRLLDAKVVRALRHYREHARFLRGMISAMGYRKTTVEFVAPPRFAGESKFSPKKMLHLAMDGVLAYSSLPLRLGLYAGILCTFISILIFLHVLIEKFIVGDTEPGWATIIGCITFFGAVQLVTLGLIGVYIGRIFEEVKRRPLYLVAREKRLRKRKSDANESKEFIDGS